MSRLIFRRLPLLAAILLSRATFFTPPSIADESALTKDSPEVRRAIERGASYLAANGTRDGRLGACALAGMSLLASGESAHHPTVVKCAEAIRQELGKPDVDKLDRNKFDVYSAGLSVIFLCDLSPAEHRSDIEFLLMYLRSIQKPHGGWGYPNLRSGDTSMTQYGVLASWKAKHAGIEISLDSVEKAARWLMLTQDPSGGFGYQGKIGEHNALANQSEVRQSLTAAGLGSLYACCELLGVEKAIAPPKDDITPGMKEIDPDDDKSNPAKNKTTIDPKWAFATADRGNQWFAINFKVDAGQYNYYYIYAFERYVSLRDYCEKKTEDDPQWYSDIADFLLKKQAENGSWSGDCGVVPDTSFALLFLRRSMQSALPFGEGLMIGGRSIPKNTKGATVNAEGQIVSPRSIKDLQSLLDDIEKNPHDYDNDSLAPLYKLPEDSADVLVKKNGDVLRRLAACKSPQVRLAIVKGVLGKTRDLDNVEVLIYAMTDPAPEVVHAAHEALARIRRSPEAITLPDKFTEEDRRTAIENWKEWYRSIRPDAKFEWPDPK